MTTYDELAEPYAAGRMGYSNDLYNTLVAFGLNPRNAVLDVGCGTGLASRPLIENAFRVTGVDVAPAMLEKARASLPSARWVVGTAERLPFDDGQFDVAISAQTVHHFERHAALAEMVRVLKPGGMAAIWWKSLMSDDPVKMLRDDVARDLGAEPLHSGLSGGFKEFYATPFATHALRVIPWHTSSGLEEYLAYERSRKLVHDTFGGGAENYVREVERRLRETFGEGNPILPLNYLHFLYLGRTK